MVYLKSDGNDWLAGSNVGKFDGALNSMLSSNCVDENRIFATGHSSGAQFVTTLLCGGEDRFLGTAPVAGGIIGQCNNHPAVHQLYIHGKMDSQRGNGNGSEAANLVIGVNMCGSAGPYEQPGCNSNYDGAAVDPGCSEYQDCSHRTVWCSHNDQNYGGSGANHGWPCFANDAIKTFFDSL
jgi:poly(3-hydroxybutyrate) depolymerase